MNMIKIISSCISNINITSLDLDSFSFILFLNNLSITTAIYVVNKVLKKVLVCYCLLSNSHKQLFLYNLLFILCLEINNHTKNSFTNEFHRHRSLLQ